MSRSGRDGRQRCGCNCNVFLLKQTQEPETMELKHAPSTANNYLQGTTLTRHT